MTRDELWRAYCERNPAFAEDESAVTATGKGVRLLFEQTWEMAYKAGAASAMPGAGVSSLDDLFRQFDGGGRR